MDSPTQNARDQEPGAALLRCNPWLQAAIVLGAFTGLIALGRYTDHAATRVHDVSSIQAAALTPQPTIAVRSPSGGAGWPRYVLMYPTRNRLAQELFDARPQDAVRSARPAKSFAARCNPDETLSFECSDRDTLVELRDTLVALDVQVPATTVIRGRLTDTNGSLMANVTVDVFGRGTMINWFQTRADGSFTLVIPRPPSEKGFYLRLRPRGGGGRFYSARFEVDETSPAVAVAVSRTVFEKDKLFYGFYVLAFLVLGAWLVLHAYRLYGALRLRYFRRPGSCLNCGYDLRGAASDVCSECGTPIPEQVRIELAIAGVRPVDRYG